MKKLNKKGFTLIELLAVIVILAIIVVVTVPTIINTINDARRQSIWNLAGSIANSYDTAVAQDLLASTPTISTGSRATSNWQCINDELVKKLDISEKDVNINKDGTVPVTAAGEIDTTKIQTSTCSAIRINSNGGAEVFLVSTTNGKFAIATKVVYALSTGEDGVDTAPYSPPSPPQVGS